ncbi:NAD(P)-dependent oxidoreductase [Deinococcus alpinitundrae]|uniref:NAD(P)-dependent oxidoreductase n=1 Tax=Deinococcus alpinitundrae TaxID=468913 RepID=UPI00192A5978|nr:NAD(P)-dependent oxidoreductase [Deinococcus alpinitundrae]
MSAPSGTTLKVAFIGTGLMGRPMVRCLLGGGVSVTVFNRSPGPLEELEKLGATKARNPAEAVRQAEVVITMLPNGDVVGDVLRSGVLDAARPGTLFIDMSSIHPALAREHAALIAAEDCQSLDAPVSGGTVGAEAGTLAIMAGGDEADFGRAAPLLALMGRPTLVGPHGAGQLCKLVNQAIVAVTIGAVAEGLSLARAGGADPVRVREAILGGFAQSRILELHGQRMNERRFEPGGTITNQVKDLDAVLDVAARSGITLPLSQRVHELFGSMLEAGEGGLDHSALILELERL